MSIARAIEQLEADIATYGQGTNLQPAEGSAAWHILRAKSLGLSYLKRAAQLKLEGDPAATERFYRAACVHVKVEVPEEPPAA